LRQSITKISKSAPGRAELEDVRRDEWQVGRVNVAESREGQRENKTLQNTHVPVKIKIVALPAAAAGGLIILIMATISFCQAADYGFEASS
jgi:hypothetical protein